jgi:hypothetical protein
MVRLDAHLADLPSIQLARFMHQLSQPYGYLASEHPLTVFRYPYQVHLYPVLCMCARPISGHGQIMPDIPPLRQLRRLRSGRPFIPELESSGFSGRLYKIIRRASFPLVGNPSSERLRTSRSDISRYCAYVFLCNLEMQSKEGGQSQRPVMAPPFPAAP